MQPNWHHLAEQIKRWALELGFSQLGISDTDLHKEEPRLQAWLDANYHGEMAWMSSHGMKRARPSELEAGTLRVLSVRMDYLPEDAQFASTLGNPNKAYISRYALGRDYHKVLRNRLKQLGEKIQAQVGPYGFRPFVDSAPVLERPLAVKAGLGWQGKHSLVLHKEAGSFFFLGELFVDLPLPVDQPSQDHCGSCVACITMCPTNAIVAPYTVDARRCISYLTIELQTEIPEEFRKLLGNRIYGCDDCQLVCPVNQQAQISQEQDFQRRKHWLDKSLIELWLWSEAEFLQLTEGSAIRRIGHERWLRNCAVALGNAPYSEEVIQALQSRSNQVSELVQLHLDWALLQQNEKKLQQQKNLWLEKNLLSRPTERLVRIIEKGLSKHA